MKVLVLGASGMLGFAVHRILHDSGYAVTGAVRGQPPRSQWCRGLHYRAGVDVESVDDLLAQIDSERADVVVNAAGVRSAGATEAEYRRLFAVNAVLPRALAGAAGQRGFHFIHFSSDGVFSGARGAYDEQFRPDANDSYGMSKMLGEALNERTLVFRSSMLGRGLQPNASLLDWFLSQSGEVRGYSRAVFSGPTVDEIARLLAGKVLSRSPALTGLFHLGAAAISKLDVLQLVRSAWSLDDITLCPDDSVAADRSLDCRLLRETIGYAAPDWRTLIVSMRDFYSGLDRRAGRTAASS